MAELLLELFSEEIPARMQARAAEDLQRLVTDGLKAAGLEFDSARSFVTPRRLTLVIDGLPDKTPDLREERRGPKVDAPQKAIEGFLGSVGLTRDQVQEVEDKKGTYLMAVVEKKGRPTAEVIAEVVPDVIRTFPWPKSMKWGVFSLNWVRPLKNVLVMFAGRSVQVDIPFEPISYQLPDGRESFHSLPLVSDAFVHGHRFMKPDPFPVDDFEDYKAKLRDAYVVLDPAERRFIIGERLEEEGERLGIEPMKDEGLLAEVGGLVEWPVVLIGRIDEQFMDVPDEALISAIKTHQKYFTFTDPQTGKLAPFFAVVANLEAPDGGKAIVAGNERVLAARLADTKFFWDQDRSTSLQSRVTRLNDITFYEKLGSVGDKVDRVGSLAVELCRYLPEANRDAVRSAARLCKADLVTEMVGEFPELQGIMGRYYALEEGESAAVAEAIADHYRPQGPNDVCPTAPESVAVALADKIDTLVGFFGIDEKPTGSKDPFALRRAALGVIRLITENRLRMPLQEVFRVAGQSSETGLLEFFADRLKVHLREQGIRHDLISAVFALGGEDDLVRLIARVEALQDFLASEDGANLQAAYKRATNIVRIEEKKDGASYEGAVRPELLQQDEEKALNDALGRAVEDAVAAIEAEDFKGAMTAIARLRSPVDAFFDNVTVNAEDADLRANRLRLLSQIRNTLNKLADFSLIEGA